MNWCRMQTKQYTIYTRGSLDTVGTLYDCCGNSITEVDDYIGKINFHIVRTLAAGSTYYIRVRLADDGIGSYTVRVTDTIFASGVRLSHQTIYLAAGRLYELPIKSNQYFGVNGAEPISGFFANIIPANASNQEIWWWEDNNDIINVTISRYDNNRRYCKGY